ncbi:MAG: UDP-N-acetylmuramate dehydrogenase [Pyrinomonadaceae bacterium]
MSLDILENIPLAPLTTLKVGGPARCFAQARSERDVVDAFEFADSNNLNVFVLGGGSNILVSDEGFDGLVLQIALRGIEQNDVIIAAAGEDWDEFVAFCVQNDLAGVECLSGIPGSVGGTPVQNVGAYGQEVSESIVSVRCFDRSSHEIVELSNKDCGFEYRKSIFNSYSRDRYVVLSVAFDLVHRGKARVAYKDIREYFDGREPTLFEVREAVLKIRGAKSMVIDGADPNSRSAGSFFKNPVVQATVLTQIADKLMIPTVPHFRFNDTEVKIPAAWLIENAGFSKGYVHGNAGISSNHSLAIINRGGASAKEIISLKNEIQSAVGEKFDIELQTEPVFVGF